MITISDYYLVHRNLASPGTGGPVAGVFTWIHLRPEFHRYCDFSDATYCLDAPDVLPAGSHTNPDKHGSPRPSLVSR